jgi:hypothetical protein
MPNSVFFRRFVLLTATLSCGMFVAASSSVVVGGFSGGPDFSHPPMLGYQCLAIGCFTYPLGWLANSVLFGGVISLLSGRPRTAALLGVAALGLGAEWTVEFLREFPADLLGGGYCFWLLSMGILTLGSSIAAADRRRPSRSHNAKERHIT